MNETNLKNFSGVETKIIGIEGMTCDKCVQTVTRALRDQPGVQDVTVDQKAAIATVTFDRSKTDVPRLHEALLRSGYRPTRTAS